MTRNIDSQRNRLFQFFPKTRSTYIKRDLENDEKYSLTHKETNYSNSLPKHDRHVSEETWKMMRNIRWLTKKQTIPILYQILYQNTIDIYLKRLGKWRKIFVDLQRNRLFQFSPKTQLSTNFHDQHTSEETWKMRRNIPWLIIKQTVPILPQNTIDTYEKRLGKWQERARPLRFGKNYPQISIGMRE